MVAILEPTVLYFCHRVRLTIAVAVAAAASPHDASSLTPPGSRAYCAAAIAAACSTAGWRMAALATSGSSLGSAPAVRVRGNVRARLGFGVRVRAKAKAKVRVWVRAKVGVGLGLGLTLRSGSGLGLGPRLRLALRLGLGLGLGLTLRQRAQQLHRRGVVGVARVARGVEEHLLVALDGHLEMLLHTPTHPTQPEPHSSRIKRPSYIRRDREAASSALRTCTPTNQNRRSRLSMAASRSRWSPLISRSSSLLEASSPVELPDSRLASPPGVGSGLGLGVGFG